MIPSHTFRAYRAGDEVELARLEALVEPTPWTAGDFLDVPKNGWSCEVMVDNDDTIQAWAVVMPVLDEAELLTIGVDPTIKGKAMVARCLTTCLHACKTIIARAAT